MGDKVNAGDLIVDGYMTIKEQIVKINVIATVSIIVSQEFTYIDKDVVQEQKAIILAKAMAYDKDIVWASCKCQKEQDTYIYTTTLNYRYIIYAG